MWKDVSWLVVYGVVGAAIGLILAQLSPSRCRQFARWSCDHRRSMLFAAGLLFFSLASILSFRDHQAVHGVLFAAMAILQLFAFFCVRMRKELDSH